jgi:hypothetical protein
MTKSQNNKVDKALMKEKFSSVRSSITKFLSLKIAILAILTLCLQIQVNGQHRKVRNLPGYDDAPYHFGFILGMNHMLFTIKPFPGFQDTKYYSTSNQIPDVYADSGFLYGVGHNPNFGFTIGIVSNLRISDNLDLRFVPSLSFGERDIYYNMKTWFNSVEDAEPMLVTRKIQSTFVEFPLNLKYKGTRYNNTRPYWLAGARYSLDLASDSKVNRQNNDVSVVLQKNDLYAELGAGVDFYTTFFKFGIEAKMAYGLLDVLRRNETIYTKGIDKFHSKIFLLSFTFE